MVGPTASGKSALAFQLARALGGAILCVDSTTIYRGLDLGTAKPTTEERSAVPHYLLDLLDLGESATVAWFQERATAAISDARQRGLVPMLVGGSHLYFKALVEGYDIPPVEADPEFRAWAQTRPLAELYDELIRRDPESRVDRLNPRRVIRALEVVRSGTSFAAHQRKGARLDVTTVGLECDSEWLRARVRRRLDAMLAQGWVEEVRDICKNGKRQDLERLRPIGYCEILDFLDGRLTLAEATERIYFATCKLIKKQRTWYRREQRNQPVSPLRGTEGGALPKGTAWLAADAPDLLERALELARTE